MSPPSESVVEKWARRLRTAGRRTLHLGSRPAHARVLVRDAVQRLGAPRPLREHAAAAMEWLRRAQDQTGCGGVAALYSLTEGWGGPYPETTGYIIETFLDWADRAGVPDDVERARRMGDWEIDVQLPNGAVRGLSGINPHPIVFNTGQVIFGWVALARRTGDERYTQAARRAGDWLVEVMDEDGKWSRHVYRDVPTVYHARVAWALHELAAFTGDSRYAEAANRNLRWTLAQRTPTGHFRHMGFDEGVAPFTHTIAYTLRGLQESARFVDGELRAAMQESVRMACDRIVRAYELRKSHPNRMPQPLPATLDSDWKSRDRFSCLTGNVQLAAILLREHRRMRDVRYLNAALKLIDQVAATQPLNTRHPGVRGGIAGSFPVWGRYMRMAYPNWAAKFFVDAVLLAEDVLAAEPA
jgi:hypothetical protein